MVEISYMTPLVLFLTFLGIRGQVNLTPTPTTQCIMYYYGTSCSTFCKEGQYGGHYICDPRDGHKICVTNFYAEYCNVYCKPQNDDIHGHFTCNSATGQKICLDDYYAIEKNCTVYCKPSHFFQCDADGKFICVKDHYGPDCNKICQTDLFGGHYDCDKDGNMICHEYYYNIDAYCQTYCKPNELGQYNCSSEGEKVCAPSFVGPQCNCTNDTSGHFTCDPDTGRRICGSGWLGPDCNCDNTTIHEGYYCDERLGRVCYTDYYGPNCTHCPKPSPPRDHYLCDTQTGQKICDPDFYGLDCDNFCRNSYHYICDNSTGQRLCNESYFGPSCETFCNESRDLHFHCDPQTGAKMCDSGWTGELCEVEIYNPFEPAFIATLVLAITCIFILLTALITMNRKENQFRCLKMRLADMYGPKTPKNSGGSQNLASETTVTGLNAVELNLPLEQRYETNTDILSKRYEDTYLDTGEPIYDDPEAYRTTDPERAYYNETSDHDLDANDFADDWD